MWGGDCSLDPRLFELYWSLIFNGNIWQLMFSLQVHESVSSEAVPGVFIWGCDGMQTPQALLLLLLALQGSEETQGGHWEGRTVYVLPSRVLPQVQSRRGTVPRWGQVSLLSTSDVQRCVTCLTAKKTTIIELKSSLLSTCWVLCLILRYYICHFYHSGIWNV